MSVNEEKKFVIRKAFENVLNWTPGRGQGTNVEEHFGIRWEAKLARNHPDGDKLRFYLSHLRPENCKSDWSIDTEVLIKIGGHSVHTISKSHTFSQRSFWGDDSSYINWNDIHKYVAGGNVPVEATVIIKKFIGFDFHPKKQKIFDDDVAKEFSDVVLWAGNRKFYVCKMYLASHSTYFKSLFSGNFSESQKSAIELEYIDPYHFQKFLEILYGESTINDIAVEGILKLADMYDAKTAIRRCEEFLTVHSKFSVKEKFEIAVKYKLNELTMKCISQMKTVQELGAVVPEDVYQLDHNVLAELFKKLLTLKS